MSKHTPGPWLVIHQKKPDGMIVIGIAPHETPTRWVARVALQPGPGRSFEEEQANALLIAAGPDLLEAAKLARSLIRGSGFSEHTKALIALNEAISKAEGISEKE